MRSWPRRGSTTTPCTEHPNALGYTTARSLDQIIAYDAYNRTESFPSQPMQIVAGSKWMSDDLYIRAASEDKQFHVGEGANYIPL